jgi:hypothetical protein
MLGRYANDIFAYDSLMKQEQKSLTELLTLYFDKIHHKNDLCFNFYKLFSLESVQSLGQSSSSFYELGQTLFGCIEGMEFAQLICNILDKERKDNVDLKNINWYGVDISPFFNYLSHKMHPQYRIFTGENFKHLHPQVDTFFSKGVTLLYAVNNAQSIYDLIAPAACGFFDYSFSLKANQIATIPTGKQVTFVSFAEFKDFVKKQNIHVWVNANTAKENREIERVYVECFFGKNEEVGERFVSTLNTFEKKLSAAINSPELMTKILNSEKSSRWIKLEEFC